MYILDKISRPHLRPLDEGWFRVDFRRRNSLFFSIRADIVADLDLQLRRIRWAESLKIVRIYQFWPGSPHNKLVVGGKTVSQNRWVYDAVAQVLSPKRMAVAGRRQHKTAVTMDLPELPKVYHILETGETPPYLVRYKACDYHLYLDEHPELSASDEDEE